MRSPRSIGSVFTGVVLFIGAAGSPLIVRGADNPLSGRWICRSDDLRVDMEFSESGKCTAKATTGARTASVGGRYKLGPNELVLTPATGEPIIYRAVVEGQRLKLSGGDLGNGSLVLQKRGGDAVNENLANAIAPAKPVVARPMADDAKDKEPKTIDTGDTKLPGGKWVSHGMEDKRIKTIKVRYDDVKSVVTFLVERLDTQALVFNVFFYDEDDVQIAATRTVGDPSSVNAAGERQRFNIELPGEAVMKKCVKVVIKPGS